MLLLTALIWGMAFVVQRSGMSYLGPYTFQSVRTLLASVVLLPMALVSKKRRGSAWRMPPIGFALPGPDATVVPPDRSASLKHLSSGFMPSIARSCGVTASPLSLASAPS